MRLTGSSIVVYLPASILSCFRLVTISMFSGHFYILQFSGDRPNGKIVRVLGVSEAGGTRAVRAPRTNREEGFTGFHRVSVVMLLPCVKI